MAGFAIVECQQDQDAAAAYIQTIEVAANERRHGVGSDLLRLAEASAIAAGAHLIWLHADAKNSSALRLYERHGYSSQGREEHYYARNRAALIYSKSLQNGIALAEQDLEQ